MGKKVLVCNFCNKSFGGGGRNRLKKHLAGIQGEVAECEYVDQDVKEAILASLKYDKHTKNDDEEQMIIEGIHNSSQHVLYMHTSSIISF